MQRIVLILFALAAVCAAAPQDVQVEASTQPNSQSEEDYEHHGHHGHHVHHGHHGHHHHHHHPDGEEDNDSQQEEHHGPHKQEPPRPQFLMTEEMRAAFQECKSDSSKDGLGCLVSCVMQKLREMDDNGKLNEKKIVEDIYKKAQLEEKIARSCIAEIHAGEGLKPCEVADAFIGCIVKKSYSPHKHHSKNEGLQSNRID